MPSGRGTPGGAAGEPSRPGASEPAGSPRPPATVEFEPRRGARRFASIVLLLALATTVVTAIAAVREPRTLTLGALGAAAVALVLLWGLRTSLIPLRLRIRGGQLEVQRGPRREVFDLTSRYTPVEEQGVPGRRGWRVLIGRFDDRPLVVDSSMVDPHAFSEALRRFRPE